MTREQIEEKLAIVIESFTPENFLHNFLLAYNGTKAEIARLQKGSLNLSKTPGETIIKSKLFFKEVSTEELEDILPLMAEYKGIIKNKIRFLIATDYITLKAIDTKSKASISIPIKDISKEMAFFLPLAGMETYQEVVENEADVKVAGQMAKLFDEIKKVNPTKTLEQVHELNIFLSRLLFCFFAEDTGIFSNNLFTASIFNHTQSDGSDLQVYLQKIFDILNTKTRPENTPTYLSDFPYVNGGLFKEPTALPTFNTKIRQVIIECGGHNWASINPDIFGSMIQAVVTPDKRGNLGMHYTSVPNIMKVIQPLFLDELYEEFEANKTNIKGLQKLLSRIANIRIFDPACGSGNFLIIAYKQLRLLEIKILTQLKNLQTDTNEFTGFEESQTALFSKPQLSLADAKQKGNYQIELFSRIELNHFYGIELDDFAHEIAKLSLWLAQHQMNMEFNNLLGATQPSLPLSDAGQITCGNATRLDWEKVCPKPKVGEVFILGNPPYLGAKNLIADQRSDMNMIFEKEGKTLDYIASWFYLASNYANESNVCFAFVTTNSICQGEQVALLWPKILEKNLEIFFAHQSFKWNNNAKANAAVTVVIVGIRNKNTKPKTIFTKGIKHIVDNINPYLAQGKNLYIYNRNLPFNNYPEMIGGNVSYDSGFLIFTIEEMEEFIASEPKSKNYFKKLMGGVELINGNYRYCLWFKDFDLKDIEEMPNVFKRIEKVKLARLAAKDIGTHKLALRPHQFRDLNNPNSYIAIPKTSSERRDYVPIAFLDSTFIPIDSLRVIPTRETYIFSFIASKMHMIWVKTVGGRLKTDFRYSVKLTYNTFPFPPINQAQKDELEQHTHNVLKERAKHTEKTLAELYDPKKMPDDLRAAHEANDRAVEKCYREKPFESDEERLAYLFNLYEQMIAEEKSKGTLFADGLNVKPTKKAKKK